MNDIEIFKLKAYSYQTGTYKDPIDNDYNNGYTICHYLRGTLLKLEYFNKNEQLHRIDGPAWMNWYDTDIIYRLEWRLNGLIHRENGPAIISYHSNGEIMVEEYFLKHIMYENKQHYYQKLYELGKINKEQLILEML